MNERLQALFAELTDASRFQFVVNEVYGEVNSLSVKSVRIQDDPQRAREITQQIANDGVLRLDKAELATIMGAAGVTFERDRVKGAGMEYIYYFIPATADNPGLQPEFAAFGVNREYIAERKGINRQRFADRRYMAAGV